MKVSICPPSVRTVAVCGRTWRNPDGSQEVEVVVHEVLALQVAVDDDGQTWHEAIIADPEAGLIPASLPYSAPSELHEIAVAPWPREVDQERLAPIIANVRRRLSGGDASRRKPQTNAS